jgi:hypothetical protein
MCMLVTFVLSSFTVHFVYLLDGPGTVRGPVCGSPGRSSPGRPSVRDGTAVQSQHCNAGEKATISQSLPVRKVV